MIRIAVCDDSKIDRELICYLVNEYIKENPDIEFQITSFSNAFKLIDDIENPQIHEKFDIYLLDMIMPNIKGIEAGTCIRKYDKECHIIFITSSSEYAIQSYDVIASGYIVKPVNKKKFFETLDRVVKNINTDNLFSPRIPVKTKNGLQQLQIHKIRYAEYSEHVICFHLIKGDIISTSIGSMTLSGLAEKLKDEASFVMPHRAFIVNLEYVKSIKSGCFVMNDNSEIPISRTSMKEIKQKYIDFSQNNI